MKGIKFFYITCPKKKEAHKIAAFLVKNKLVACANIIHNVDSVSYTHLTLPTIYSV